MIQLTHYEIILLEQLDKQIDEAENAELRYQLLSLKLDLVKHLNQQEINLRTLETEERKLEGSYRPRYYRYRPTNASESPILNF
ncbi:hypothetical protein [Haemophilus haemolyticus]|uniref:hypothetical protein n=1 Tax=Haemophilus haemolyticus TaxID=726 RepID=UPI000E56B511|nr:hypothetical protein [Haemophilus haemolyticus]